MVQQIGIFGSEDIFEDFVLAPIRGGYQGGAGLSKMAGLLRYHAQLTGGPWDAVQNVVDGSRMLKQTRENGFFSCPHQGSES